MPPRLLDRQTELLRYLTGADAIFGAAPLPAGLSGLDRERLCLEARLSHGKRMEKIEIALPRTVKLARAADPQVDRRFAAICPAEEAGRSANARQFRDFVAGASGLPPYLYDLASCELAIVEALASTADAGEASVIAHPAAVRRDGAVTVLSLDYDVRQVFEDAEAVAEPRPRRHRIVVATPRDDSHPQILELPPAIMELLGQLDDWVAIDALSDDPDFGAMLHELQRQGVLEFRA